MYVQTKTKYSLKRFLYGHSNGVNLSPFYIQTISGGCLNIDYKDRRLRRCRKSGRIDRVIQEGRLILWEVKLSVVMRKISNEQVPDSEWLTK